MDIKAEIARLAPWHYSMLIQGYSTGDSPVEITHPKLVQLRHAGAFQRTFYPRVLDLGSNAGHISFWFVDNTSSQVDAVEFHLRYYEQLKFAIEHKGYIGRVNPLYADIETVELDNCQYDLVLLLGVLHHLRPESHLETLIKCRKSLLPGGEFVLQSDSKLPLFDLLTEAKFTNIRELPCNWDDRKAYEAMKDPMKLYDC